MKRLPKSYDFGYVMFPFAAFAKARSNAMSTIRRDLPVKPPSVSVSRLDMAKDLRRSWWPWVGGGLLAVVIAAVALAVLQRRLSPVYWTAEDLGPIAINQAKPGGPAPDGMLWIPGGTYWMGSDDFQDAQPVHKV